MSTLAMVVLFVHALVAMPPAPGPALVGARFRAMSPGDSDFAMKDVLCADRSSKLRAEVATRFGVDFGPRPHKIVLELRPKPHESGSAHVEGFGDVFECAGELSGSLDELCERFLRNATVTCPLFAYAGWQWSAVFDCSTRLCYRALSLQQWVMCPPTKKCRSKC